ncbi:hypothetical protein ACRYI5_06630 [Furfurilactobacillus sp. WILCCON 0119]|uniref:hypothetical protein n=1 Tax=Furfurilactobacillus entadae TaxID=2922307 RepID=UPI0035E5E779
MRDARVRVVSLTIAAWFFYTIVNAGSYFGFGGSASQQWPAFLANEALMIILTLIPVLMFAFNWRFSVYPQSLVLIILTAVLLLAMMRTFTEHGAMIAKVVIDLFAVIGLITNFEAFVAGARFRHDYEENNQIWVEREEKSHH